MECPGATASATAAMPSMTVTDTTRASHRFVVLLPGETAHVILHIEFPSPLGPTCNPKMGELHITLGGMSTDLLGYPVAQCRNTKLNLLTVDPIHSGVGVPAFTIR